MQATDAYKETESISNSLAAAGLVEFASQISSAVSEGSTGTEIYMILRWRLANIIKDGALPTDIRGRALSLHKCLDDELTRL